MKSQIPKLLVEKFGEKYSEILGINLAEGRENEIFKWFLASILFGAPIAEKAATKTYKCFEKYGILTPRRILETGWDRLVQILDEGSYTRYDFKTADKLLETMNNLMKNYDGSLTRLYNKAKNTEDLTKKLKTLGKGIGDVTVSIFLRELREIWKKAEPEPTALVVLAAKKLGIIEEKTKSTTENLKNFWRRNSVAGKSFVNFETALLRLGKDYCRKRKCAVCLFKTRCLSPEAS